MALVLGAIAACYLGEESEAPQAEVAPRDEVEPRDAPDAEDAAAPSSASEHRGVAAVVEDVRREDAARVEAVQAEQARRAALEAEAAALSPEERAVRAKLLFKEGLEAFERGDALTARDRFAAAYVLTPHLHALAFNVARAAEQAGDCCTARAFYRRFLEHEVDTPQRPEVQRRLDALVCEDCPDAP